MPRPTTGTWETRAQPIQLDSEQRIRGVIPYGVESRDLGGYTEVIDRGALDSTNLDSLVATVEHSGVPIGRYPTTLQLEDRTDGLHWAVSPPASRPEVIEAVQRGDLQAGSWRMRVARERWQGNVRHVTAISELRDVSVVAQPAYTTAAVELRHLEPNPAEGQEDPMPESTAPATEPDTQTPEPTATGTAVEDGSASETPQPPSQKPGQLPGPPSGQTQGLTVEDRSLSDRPRGSLGERFRAAGFPDERATLPFAEVFEDRSVTWTGSVDLMNQTRVQGLPLGADQRFAWPAFPRVGVDPGVTSVAVASQTARSLASAASMVRAIDATSDKPETGSTLTVTQLPLQQVASVSSAIPNVYLLPGGATPVNSIVENDLTLAINQALDSLVIAGLATAGHVDPTSTTLLAAIRQAVEELQAAGYNADVLLLDPASAVKLDTLVASEGSEFYVFSPGAAAPGTIFGAQRRIVTNLPAPAVCDSHALGRMFASPVSLARFEQNAGVTNTSVIRMECNAVFATERPAAAVRIAAS
ncbi:MAG: HK97 family phage prohead protease [Solirubrobacterales bacterium]|nr:HK97 family phage prohead protease [Solirubrobacterales bacterium]